jgi:hypothetical protein
MAIKVRAYGAGSKPNGRGLIAQSPLVERTASNANPAESILVRARKPKEPLNEKASEILNALQEASLMLPLFDACELRLDLDNGAALEIERNRCVYSYPDSGKLSPGWQHSVIIELWADNKPDSKSPSRDAVEQAIDSFLSQSRIDQSSRAKISRIISNDKSASVILLALPEHLRRQFEEYESRG